MPTLFRARIKKFDGVFETNRIHDALNFIMLGEYVNSHMITGIYSEFNSRPDAGRTSFSSHENGLTASLEWSQVDEPVRGAFLSFLDKA